MLLHCKDFEAAFEALSRSTAPEEGGGRGASGILETIAKTTDYIASQGICPDCLETTGTILGDAESGPHIALGIIIGVLAVTAIDIEGDRVKAAEPEYTLWMNTESTVLVTRWKGGAMQVAIRPDSGHVWGPPYKMERQP